MLVGQSRRQHDRWLGQLTRKSESTRDFVMRALFLFGGDLFQ